MVSVIVPVYNSSKALESCVNSLLRQTYDDLEIILVNDASTDNSLEIIKEFHNKDNRVKIINNLNNEGAEASRLKGLREAKGKWVMFVDSDDMLANKHVILEIVRIGESQNVDLVQFGGEKISRHGIIKQEIWRLTEGRFVQPDIYNKFYKSFFGFNKFPCNMCGKLFKRSVVENIKFKTFDIFIGDDQLFLMQVFPFIESIYITNLKGYNYRTGGGSGFYSKFFEDALKIYEFKKNEVKKNRLYEWEPYLFFELKNYFKSDLINKIKYKKEGKKELLQYIDNVVNTHLSEVVDYYRKEVPVSLQEPFVRAIINNDYEKVLEICCNILKKHRIQNYFRNIVIKYF